MATALTLDRQKAKLQNLNLRTEIQGDRHVGAADIKIQFDTANSILSEFDPGLRSSIYRRAEFGDAQGALPMGEDQDHMPKLRFPKMGPFKWDATLKGARVVIHYGVDGKADVSLDADVDNFSFDCHDGGSVTVTMRVQAHPAPEHVATLYQLIQCEIEVSLQPPGAELVE